MKFLHLHDLNSPDREVLINASLLFHISFAPAGTGSALIFEDNEVIYVHESPDEVETLAAD